MVDCETDIMKQEIRSHQPSLFFLSLLAWGLSGASLGLYYISGEKNIY